MKTATTKKTRTPRALSQMEIEAKQQYDDARVVTKLMPQVMKLSHNGRDKLARELAKFENMVDLPANDSGSRPLGNVV